MKSLMVLSFLWSAKKLHNQNQNLISEYLNTNAKSIYSYNNDDILAANTYWVLTVPYVENILHVMLRLIS